MIIFEYFYPKIGYENIMSVTHTTIMNGYIYYYIISFGNIFSFKLKIYQFVNF